MKKSLLLLLSLLVCGSAFSQQSFKPKSPTRHKSTPEFQFQEIDGSKTQATKRAAFYKESLPLSQLTKNKVLRDTADAAYLFIENKQSVLLSANAKVSIEQLRTDFLEKNKATIGLESPAKELKVISEEQDEVGGTHIRMQQLINEVPIYGAELVLHLKQLAVTSLNGRAFRTQTLDTTPAFQATNAIELALQDIGKTSIIQSSGLTGQLLQLQKNEAELIIYPIGSQLRLAYHLTVRPNLLERWVYFIDAKTGDVLDKYNHTCTLDGVFKTTAKDLNGKNQEFRIYEKGGVYYMLDATQKMFNSAKSQMPDNPVGAIWTIDAQNARVGDNNMQLSHVTSANGTSWSATAVSAHVNATRCYEYYTTAFGRNSLNGTGGSIISVINILDEDGKGLDNAFWNGEFMAYGNGQTAFKPLAGALDVAGHEMTHGIVENTARLEYRNQSGALNESFADIFGALIDRDDWLMGEDVTKTTAFPSGALRSLQDPNQGGKSLRDRGYQPKIMTQYEYLKDTEAEDYGGVHINSGIPNYAFYLFASNASVGKDRAEKVYYQALTKYLSRTSKFLDLRVAVIQAAKDLYGDGAISNAAIAAFDAVGIGSSSGGTTTTPPKENNDIPINPGTESLIVYDPVEGTLYSGPYSSGGDFKPIATKYGCLSKPSVTDDGQYVYFVGSDKNIYQKNLTTTVVPAKLTSNGGWRNVSVSKDGKRLAALTTDYDAYMYVFDLTKNPAATSRFKLYNPTYSQGVSTGEVVYADSFEWDYTGEFIIYDAYNSVKGFSGEYYFADVGIIRVWDVSKNGFGEGTIEKLFTDLEEGENIGNPSYSKTSKSIVIFDYAIFGEDDNTNDDDEFYIIGVDFSKSGNDAIKLVVENNTVGYPDYAKADDKVVYNADESGKEAVKGIAMSADKISSAGKPVTFFTDAKWAVWYAQGQRQLPTKKTQTITFTAIADQQPSATIDLKATSNAGLAVQFRVKNGDATLSGSRLKAGTTAGKVTVEAFQIGTSEYAEASAEQTFCILPKTPTITKNGANLVASGGTLYQWFVNGNPVGGQTSSNILAPSFAGTYTVRAITSDGCLSAASNGIISQPLSAEPSLEKTILLYPNPATNVIKLTNVGVGITQLDLFDTNGRWLQTIDKTKEEISVNQLPMGTYLLQITTKKGIVMKKFIKE